MLPEEVQVKRRIEDTIREVYRLYGYQEVETPTVEYLSLFEAKSGEEIRHRMFKLVDVHGRRLVLRPEVTASIARLVATKLSKYPTPLRLGYIADCYRYDEPQWGRRRRFWHGGLELFGSSDPMSDVEIVLASHEVFRRLNILNMWFRLGHVGILRGILGGAGVEIKNQDLILTMLDRKMAAEALSRIRELAGLEAENTVQQLIQLKGGEEIIGKAYDLLSPWPKAVKANENLQEIVGELSSVEPSISFKVDYGFARGLEYYTGFIFEQGVEGVDISFNGGGRYDGLVGLFGGRETPAVGCAIGITRLMGHLLSGMAATRKEEAGVMISVLSDQTRRYALSVAKSLRNTGIPAIVDVTRKRVPDAISLAVKKNIRYLVLVGEKEYKGNTITLRDLSERRQYEVRVDELANLLKTSPNTVMG